LHPHDRAFGHRRDGRYAPWLPGQASFAAELARPEDCDDNMLAAILTVNDPNGDFYSLSRENLLSLFHSGIAK